METKYSKLKKQVDKIPSKISIALKYKSTGPRKLFSVWLNAEIKQKLDNIPRGQKWNLINEFLESKDFTQFDSLTEKFQPRRLCSMYLDEKVMTKVREINRGKVASTLSNILKGF